MVHTAFQNYLMHFKTNIIFWAFLAFFNMILCTVNILFGQISNAFQSYWRFSLVFWLVIALPQLFWCAAWACCWSLSQYGRTATSSAEEDKCSVLPHSSSADGLQHFTLLIGYIIVYVSYSGLKSIWLMTLWMSQAAFIIKNDGETTLNIRKRYCPSRLSLSSLFFRLDSLILQIWF